MSILDTVQPGKVLYEIGAYNLPTTQQTINRIYHLDRGYENIENKLRKVGVNIRRIN